MYRADCRDMKDGLWEHHVACSDRTRGGDDGKDRSDASEHLTGGGTLCHCGDAVVSSGMFMFQCLCIYGFSNINLL